MEENKLFFNKIKIILIEKLFYIIFFVFCAFAILALFNILSFAQIKAINSLIFFIYIIFLFFYDKKLFLKNLFVLSVVFISLCYFVEVIFLDNLYDYFLILASLILIYEIFKKNFDIKNFIRNNFKYNPYKFLFIFLVFWFFYSIISLFFVKYLNAALSQIQFIFYAILLFLCYNYLFYLKKFDFLEKSLFFLSVFLIISSFIEVFFHKHYPTFAYANKETSSLLAGPNGGINDFATYMYIFSFLINFFLFKKLKKYFLKIIIFVLNFLLFFYLFIFTQSRANQIGLTIYFLSFFIFLFYLYFYRKKNKIFFIFILIISILILIFLSFFVYNHFENKINEFLLLNNNTNFQTLLESKDIYPNSTIVRIRLIFNSFQIIKDSCFLGVGPGNGQELMPIYSEKYYYTAGIRSIHFFWLELLVDYGIISFILFILFYFSIIFYILRNIFTKNIKEENNNINENIIIKILSLSTLLGFIIASISISTLVTRPLVWIYLYFILFSLRRDDAKENT